MTSEAARYGERVSALLGLFASLIWGVADYGGGVSARDVPVAWVIVMSQLAALAVLIVAAVVCLLTVGLDISGAALFWGALAGAAGLLALATFYRGLATGTMGIVAPVASTGVILPVVVAIVQGERPALVQLIGMGVAACGIVLATGPELRSAPAEGRRTPIMLAGFSALGFGFVAVALAHGAPHGLVPTLLTQRLVSVALAGGFLLIRRNAYVSGARRLPVLFGVGLGDGGANAAYSAATRDGLVSVAAVLSSLYPVITTLLAWRYDGERLARLQLVGVVAALAGVVMLAAG